MRHAHEMRIPVMKKLAFILSIAPLLLVSFFPDGRGAFASILSWEQVENAVTDGKYAHASVLLAEYINDNPDSAAAYILKGRLHLMLSGSNQFLMAERIFEEGMNRFRSDESFFAAVASLYHSFGYYENALHALLKAVEEGHTGEAVSSRLFEYAKHQRTREALVVLKSALDDPTRENIVPSYIYEILSGIEIEFENYGRAFEILRAGLDAGMEKADYYRSVIYLFYWNKEGSAFTDAYYAWLALENDPLILAREYELAKWAMEKKDVLIFESVPYNEKSAFLARYWRINDSYPITAQNERLLEFFRRRMYAETFYHSYTAPLGFDETGRLLIRRGMGKERRRPTVNALIAGEISAGREYRYVNYFREIGRSMNFQPEQRYDDKAFLEYMKYMPAKIPRGASLDVEPFYEINLRIPAMEFAVESYQFKGKEAKTRVEAAYGFQRRQLADRQFAYANVLPQYVIETDFVVFDSLSINHVRKRDSHSINPGPMEDIYAGTYVNADKCELPPGGYKMAFQLIDISRTLGSSMGVDDRSVRGGFVVRDLPVQDFSGQALMMSDLQFCRNIEIAGGEGGKGNLSILREPYPFRNIKKSLPVFFYFEIYNLLLAPPEKNDYRITLAVGRGEKDGSFLARPFRMITNFFSKQYDHTIETLYERQENRRDTEEFVELDFSGLPSGRTNLTVTVRDLLGEVSANRTIEFELVE